MSGGRVDQIFQKDIDFQQTDEENGIPPADRDIQLTAEKNRILSVDREHHQETDEENRIDPADSNHGLKTKEKELDKLLPQTRKVKTNKQQDQSMKWMCVFGCAIAHFVLGGFERSNGVLYLHFQERFGEKASDIAWVISLSVTLKLLFGPVASVLCTRFSPRVVVVFGTILCSIGVLISAFVPHFVLLFITFGVLTGVGKSLAYQPGLVVVGQHFEKRRSIAVGLATAGGGVGTLVLPPLLEVVLQHYGFTGGLLILSAISLHMCISGMLYRSVQRRKRLHRDSFISHSCERFYDNKLSSDSNIQIKEEDATIQMKEEQSKSKHQKIHKFWISKCLRSCCNEKDKDPSDKMIDFGLLKRPDFVMFCVGICFLALSFNSMLVFIPPLVKSRGLSSLQGAYVMSVAGVFDTIGRIASGFILNIKRVKRNRKVFYNIVMFMLSAIIFFLPFTVTFLQFCIIAAIFGLLIGTYTSQKSVILVDVVGSESLNSSFGLLIFFQGVGTLLGPPITGLFKDILNSYAYGFFFIGSTTFIGATILLLSNVTKCNKQSENTKLNKNDA